MNPVTLIVGCGEVGASLGMVLEQTYDVYYVDPKKGMRYELKAPVFIMHVCFPYSSKFEELVKMYQKQYHPKHTVIHSTVPVGTSKRLMCHHSPVRGVHPHLDKGIATFVKFLAPNGKIVQEYFEKAGIEVKAVKDTDTTEALKLWDTTQYGWNIVLEKVIYDWCEKNNVDFNIVYTEANRSYNIGYTALGLPQYKKYVLKHNFGKIGGHCVMQNLDLFQNPLNDIIRKLAS